MPGVPGQTTAGQIIQGRVYNPQQGMPGSTPGGASSAGGSSYVGGGYAIGSQPTQVQGVQTVQPGQTGQYPGMPGQPVNSQYGGVSPTPYQTTGSPGSIPGFQQPGMNLSQQNPSAQDMINRAIFGPRPGGAPQINTGGALIGGSGIAGFASKADAESIMVYNDRTNYGEWEFVFDPAKVKPPTNPVSGATGATPVSQMGSNAGISQPGTSVQDMASPGSQQPGGTGFGSSPFGQPAPMPGMGGPVRQ
jgi:hypothetical protein